MATNVYEYEDRITYDEDAVTSRYGYIVMDSGYVAGATCFGTKECRDKFAKEVGEKLGNDDDRLPGFLLLAHCGASESDRDAGFELLFKAIDREEDSEWEVWEELEDMLYAY